MKSVKPSVTRHSICEKYRKGTDEIVESAEELCHVIETAKGSASWGIRLMPVAQWAMLGSDESKSKRFMVEI